MSLNVSQYFDSYSNDSRDSNEILEGKPEPHVSTAVRLCRKKKKLRNRCDSAALVMNKSDIKSKQFKHQRIAYLTSNYLVKIPDSRNDTVDIQGMKKAQIKLKIKNNKSKLPGNNTQLNFYDSSENGQKDYFYNPEKFSSKGHQTMKSDRYNQASDSNNANLEAYQMATPKSKILNERLKNMLKFEFIGDEEILKVKKNIIKINKKSQLHQKRIIHGIGFNDSIDRKLLILFALENTKPFITNYQVHI